MAKAVLFSSIPGRYVKALFEVGKKQNILNELLGDFEKFRDFYCNNKRLFPKYGKRITAICDVIGKELDLKSCFISFLKLLTENHRLDLFSNIALNFRKTVMQFQGKQDVRILSVANPTAVQKDKIANVVSSFFNTSVNIKYITDTSLLSGFVIETNGLRIDGSGKGILKQLEKYYNSLEIVWMIKH